MERAGVRGLPSFGKVAFQTANGVIGIRFQTRTCPPCLQIPALFTLGFPAGTAYKHAATKLSTL
jgi:hypothetical protein